MTLIYTAKDAISAVVMGDVLATTDVRYASDKGVTSHLRLVVRNQDRVISGLVSKVYILRPNLAVAWTGSKIFCADVLKHWDAGLPESPVFSDLQSVVASYDASHDSEIIGALLNPKAINAFSYVVAEKTIKRGSQFIAGEGRDFFYNLITKLPYSFARRDRSLKKGNLGLGRLPLWALHRLSDLPAMEYFGHDTLENWFGCGYDFVFSRQHHFFRINSVYQVFYQVTIDPDGLARGFKLRPFDCVLTQTFKEAGNIWLRRFVTKFNPTESHRLLHLSHILSSEEREAPLILPEREHRGLGPAMNLTRVTLLFEFQDRWVYETSLLYLHPNKTITVQIVKSMPAETLTFQYSLSQEFIAKVAEIAARIDLTNTA
jgi:hypothetical protein